MSDKPTLFLLGATGFAGSQFLRFLGEDPELKDHFAIKALLRNVTPQRVAELQALYPNTEAVEGDLDTDAVIQEQASTARYVINVASSDHIKSIQSTLAGLEKNSAANPGVPPIYIQVSGLGITSDNSRGADIPLSDIPVYTDIGLDINTCPPQNQHVDQDKLIIEAGTRKENPVRTAIIFPGWIFGIGEGIQKITFPLRIFADMFQRVGHAGTWGEGHSIMGNVHVKDVANAILLVFKAMLEGRADEGGEGFYFTVSDEPMVKNRDIAAKMGDIMFEKGLLKEPGSKPLPNEILDPFGEYGWSLLGANMISNPQRLKKFGWAPTETLKKPLLESLPEELEFYLRSTGKIN